MVKIDMETYRSAFLRWISLLWRNLGSDAHPQVPDQSRGHHLYRSKCTLVARLLSNRRRSKPRPFRSGEGHGPSEGPRPQAPFLLPRDSTVRKLPLPMRVLFAVLLLMEFYLCAGTFLSPGVHGGKAARAWEEWRRHPSAEIEQTWRVERARMSWMNAAVQVVWLTLLVINSLALFRVWRSSSYISNGKP